MRGQWMKEVAVFVKQLSANCTVKAKWSSRLLQGFPEHVEGGFLLLCVASTFIYVRALSYSTWPILEREAVCLVFHAQGWVPSTTLSLSLFTLFQRKSVSPVLDNINHKDLRLFPLYNFYILPSASKSLGWSWVFQMVL